MDEFGGELERWSPQNYMKINYTKTKEIILGKIRNQNIPALTISGNPIQRVSCFKLLGVHISDNLLWESHIDYICSKTNSRLYFLKRLKRAGLSVNDLRCFYTTVVRPVLEYACVVWHHGLTKAQSDRLEALQKLFMGEQSSTCPTKMHLLGANWSPSASAVLLRAGRSTSE